MNSKIEFSNNFEMEKKENEAIEYVRALKGFYVHCMLFCVIVPCLFAPNMSISPEKLWVLYGAIAWIFAIGLQGLITFAVCDVFSAAWEHRQFLKRMGMK